MSSSDSNPIDLLNLEDLSGFNFNSSEFTSQQQDDLALFMNNVFSDYDVSNNNINNRKPSAVVDQQLDFLNSYTQPTSNEIATPSIPATQTQTPDSVNLFSTTDFTIDLSKEEDDFDLSSTSSAMTTPKTGNVIISDVEKRRRNTAASARFRIKKKLKEKEIEIQTKNLVEKVSKLNTRIKTLEMENKCLKKLIINKSKNSDSKSNYELLQLLKSSDDEGFTIASV